jgi:tetratricopeptide (TPR) repeat protein
MPIGGDDDATKRHFMGVYQSILKPAAEMAGYQVKRADIGRMPGNITADIINDLANSDMVIADLTSGNANVFFELGIRHVLRKTGTVHVVNESDEIPFDIRQYRAVKYSADLADIPTATEAIVEAIRRREDSAARSDNPVHDALTGLPSDFRDIGEDAQLRQIEQLRALLGEAERDREELSQRLQDLDPAGSLARQPSQFDIDDMLDHAEEIMHSTGEYAMLHLKRVADEEGREAFVRELRAVLKSPYLSDNDFMGLALMCRQLDLTDHRRVVLEIGYQRYPNTSSIFLGLIDAYDDSPAPTIQARGSGMLEEYLRITRDSQSASPKLEQYTESEVFENALALLFNFYFRGGHPEWVVSVCESADTGGHFNSAIGRNLGRALAELGRTEEAEAVFIRTIQEHEDSGTHQFFSDFLSTRGRHSEAYEQSELGVIWAPSSSTAFLNLAIDVFNHQYVRTAPAGNIAEVDEDSAMRAAIPLVVAGVERGDLAERQRAVSMLVRRNALAEAETIAKGGELPLDAEYDTFALKFILDQVASGHRRGSKSST